MIPPWQKYPEIERGSIGWRMGYGEDYYDEFYKWFSRLDLATWTDYAENFPEPIEWKGFYKMIMDHPWI